MDGCTSVDRVAEAVPGRRIDVRWFEIVFR